MEIKAIPTKAENLEPGDLFSFEGQEFWDDMADTNEVGKILFVRTETQTPVGEKQKELYRIEIEKEGKT